jgi:hypothetical protein
LVELGATVAAASDATAIEQALCAGGAALFEVSGAALFRREGDVLVATATSPTDGEPPALDLAVGGAPGPRRSRIIRSSARSGSNRCS